jgi:hypothetical protein
MLGRHEVSALAMKIDLFRCHLASIVTWPHRFITRRCSFSAAIVLGQAFCRRQDAAFPGDGHLLSEPTCCASSASRLIGMIRAKKPARTARVQAPGLPPRSDFLFRPDHRGLRICDRALFHHREDRVPRRGLIWIYIDHSFGFGWLGASSSRYWALSGYTCRRFIMRQRAAHARSCVRCIHSVRMTLNPSEPNNGNAKSLMFRAGETRIRPPESSAKGSWGSKHIH